MPVVIPGSTGGKHRNTGTGGGVSGREFVAAQQKCLGRWPDEDDAGTIAHASPGGSFTQKTVAGVENGPGSLRGGNDQVNVELGTGGSNHEPDRPDAPQTCIRFAKQQNRENLAESTARRRDPHRDFATVGNRHAAALD